ncbi:MAG: copper amine oxidase N-terminal domain-containing protein [Bacillota bacterium]|nr:copper amine oxidase N-terminal domain-containing protein [Bacillota bacterium]
MKKKIVLIMSTIAIALSFASLSSASSKINEDPKVKIIIDGKMNKYSKTPINYNGRTMLPFREVLTNLGVQNDDEHIAWNSSDRSVTLTKDDVKVYLKIGSKNATINSQTQALDVEPVIYKGNTYIPARFVSQALGKKVVWDDSSKSVIIRDEQGYNETKTILDKSNAATKDVSRMKSDFTADMKMKIAGQSMSMKMDGKMEIDVKDMIMHLDSNVSGMGINTKMEEYFANNKIYVTDPTTGNWTYTNLDLSDFTKQINQAAVIEASDKMYAGLTVDQSSNPDEIILKGNIYLDGLIKQLGDSFKTAGVNIKSVYMEMTLDKSTYYPKAVKMDMSMSASQKVGEKVETTEVDMTMNYNYTDFNGNYEVKLPDDVAKNATSIAAE